MSDSQDYPVSATLNNAVDPDSLVQEIIAAAITPAVFEYVEVQDDPPAFPGVPTIFCWFDVALTPSEKTVLDGVIAAHTGVQAPYVVFHASSKFVEGTAPITSTTAWETLGGVVFNPEFFVDTSLANMFGMCEGQNAATGAGAELRVLEDGAVITSVPYPVPDTTGSSQNFEFPTDVPPTAGQHLYELQGRLNGAASASVSFVTLSLMEDES